jgi:alginate O-acetyltransferase complex protein AlgI
MVFNSAVFVFFFVIVYCGYWSLSYLSDARRLQNRFLLFASYVFYGWWDWIFLGLIVASTVVDYLAARGMMADGAAPGTRRRRALLLLSILMNLGMLAAFKYFDFFITSFLETARLLDPAAMSGAESQLLLKVILPVGISFYTFQTMSYTIDVYRGTIAAEKNFLDFGLFVSFFPQLVAGPIERAGDLLPQFKNERKFSYEDVQAGAWFILFGFFMKVYVADSIAPLVDQVYLENKFVYAANPALAAGHGGAQVLLASVAFAFQIFGDFAGYSTIALGAARLLGIRLTINFETPEYSQNPAELWRRWHTTLNRWVTDYVYFPLGGSKFGVLNKYRNLLIAFLLTGLWHGANWTFVLWGAFMGIWVMGYDLSRPYLPVMPERWPLALKTVVRISKMIFVFSMFGVSATLFRAYDIQHSLELWRSMLSFPWDLGQSVQGVPAAGAFLSAILQKIALLVILDGVWYYTRDPLWVHKRATALRVLVYSALFFMVLIYGVFGKDVIYFAF